jgi:hypothetical protein
VNTDQAFEEIFDLVLRWGFQRRRAERVANEAHGVGGVLLEPRLDDVFVEGKSETGDDDGAQGILYDRVKMIEDRDRLGHRGIDAIRRRFFER